MAVAIVATTAALAPAITPSVYPLKKKRKDYIHHQLIILTKISCNTMLKSQKQKTKYWRL
jgi:hypothetical protein